MDRPTLILDADDTLWENNVFYEEATAAFLERMVQEGFARDESKHTLEQVEQERIPVVGYAPREFIRSMAITYHRLCERDGRRPQQAVEAEVEAIGRRVIDYPMLLLDGVADTVARLRSRYRLILLTKGTPQVQHEKVERSGLGPHFEAVHVVAEKDSQVLRDILERYGLDPEQTWMVGNSPRSDINPALEVGIGAIYIPCSRPWAFEEMPIADPGRVITLQSFAQLLELFPTTEASE